MTIISFKEEDSLPDHLTFPLKREEEGIASVTGFRRYFAPKEDPKVTQYFLEFIQNFIRQEAPVTPLIGKSVRLIDEYLQAIPEKTKSNALIDLERYMLAASMKLFGTGDPFTKRYQTLCEKDAAALHDKWQRYEIEEGGSDRCFFTHPELVDFVFFQKLHHRMRHPAYNHHIHVNANGKPFLLVKGKFQPWSYRPYTIDSYVRDHNWSYLQNGFEKISEDDFNNPPAFMKEPALEKSQLEIIVLHTKKSKSADFFLKGAEHVFCRVKIGTDYSLEGNEGAVYSLGFGFDQVGCQLLKSSPLRLNSPDFSEFIDGDLYITTLDVNGDQINALFTAVQKKETQLFDGCHKNCTFTLAAVLKEANIVEIPTEEPLSTMLYEAITPNFIQKGIKKIASWIPWKTPKWVHTLISGILLVFISPFYFLLGRRGVDRSWLSINSPRKVVKWQEEVGYTVVHNQFKRASSRS